MTTYHIDLKLPWEPQIRACLTNPSRLKEVPTKSHSHNGKSYSLHLGLEDRVVFKTFHKRNFSSRMAAPGGDSFENWTFTSEQDRLNIGYTDAWGHSDKGARHTPTNVPGVGMLVSLVNKGFERAAMHAVTLTPGIARHSETTQIRSNGTTKELGDTLYVRRFEEKYGYRGGSIGNKQLSTILAAWYLNRHGGSSAAGTAGSSLSGAAEIAGRALGL